MSINEIILYFMWFYSYLPLPHVYERWNVNACLYLGVEVL